MIHYDLAWVKTKYDSGETLKFIFFWGHTQKGKALGQFVFSQWYPSLFVVDGVSYKTAEHWIMAQKAKLFDDDACFEKIVRSDKPGEVKELGRQIRNFDTQQWDASKFDIVKRGNLYKFQQDAKLKDYLLTTQDRIIVEASPVDSIWGIGLSQDAKGAENPHQWKGENLLGFAIMEVRDLLK
ncbi:NADAR family protein [Pseudochryseolinea flava]|uniref:DUF1768 domain-containing protein n=1 Tax=Pseudochryseolinea flava TaxID=2059302 RepID=A0A364XZ12_9BACT|nr:NADAR family protein [Pseudochryseolinea flava]RAV99229.1 DUF1768 domain-containing protein [Pseudochryseolinea flava]